MITESMMYWITRLDGLNALFTGFVTISGLITGVLGIFAFAATMAGEQVSKTLCRGGLWFSVANIVSALALVFTPTTKEMAMIYTVPAITRSDFVQKDLPDLYDLGIKALKEQLTTNKE